MEATATKHDVDLIFIEGLKKNKYNGALFLRNYDGTKEILIVLVYFSRKRDREEEEEYDIQTSTTF